MKKIFSILSVSLVCALGMGTLVSCEDETLGFGNNIAGGESQGNKLEFDLIAYNTNEADSLRSDQTVLQNATLGTYKDDIFGKTESKFYTQMRLGVLNPEFGKNPKVDSVSLTLPIFYNEKKGVIKTDTTYIFKAPEDKPELQDTILIRKTITVDSIYGNKDSQMTVNVRDINSVLYTDTKYFSNPTYDKQSIDVNSMVIGSKKLGSTVENILIKTASKSNKEGEVIYSEPIGYKIYLKNDYFFEKIIANEKTGLLGDQASFIRRVIKGLELSVENQEGFLLKFNPGLMTIKMHYSKDNPVDKTEGQTDYKARISDVTDFSMSTIWSSTAGSNVQINHIFNSEQGAAYMNSYTNPNKVDGASRLFLRGMSGDRVNISFIKEQIDQLKTNAKANNWAIVGAKINFYIDEAYSFPKAPYILAWNNYKKEGTFVDKMFADVAEFPNSYPNMVHFNPFNKDKDYYTIDITKHIKSIVEKGEDYDEQQMVVTMGNFLLDPTNQSEIISINPFRNERVSNPYRVVLHGNKTENLEKKLKLVVYYTSK